MLNKAIDTARLIEAVILIKFKFQIQIVMFSRGHPETPIGPAPVLLSGIHCSTSHLPQFLNIGEKSHGCTYRFETKIYNFF